MIVTLTTGRMMSSRTKSISRGIKSVIVALTTGRMISSRTNSRPYQQRYRSSDSNTDYWEDDIVQD